MDKFFVNQQKSDISIKKEDLHLVGVVAILISSKYEDVQAIRTKQLITDACQGKYDINMIIEQEKVIL